MAKLTMRSATTVTLEQLSNLMNSAYESYPEPIHVTPAILARINQVQNVDLSLSAVAFDTRAGGEVPIGLHLICRRSLTARIAAFGLIPAYRGLGLAKQLAADAIDRAREAKCHRMILEVLTTNAPALRADGAAGFKTIRRLNIFVRQDDGPSLPSSQHPATRASELILNHYTRLHSWSPWW